MKIGSKEIPELFEKQGFVVVEDVLDSQKDLQPIVDEYESLLGNLADKLHAEGKLKSSYSGLPFGQRLIRMTAETGEGYAKYLDISLPQSGVSENTPMHHGKAIFGLLRNPRLLDVVETLIGPEIYSNPVQHVRIKPPEKLIGNVSASLGLSAATPWHQDNGVLMPEADESDILTVWLPILDSTKENGCLEVIPGSHRGGLQPHCPDPKKGVHIPDQYLPGRPVPLPMKRGSVLFMHRKTVHGAGRNNSQDIRWSFDLRYNPVDHPTGRSVLPGFVARSRSHPETELSDHAEWVRLWKGARARLAQEGSQAYTRWNADAPLCA